MKTWANIFTGLLMTLTAGCFPESEGQLPNFSLRIPLDQLGGAVNEEGLESWSRWRSLPQGQRSIYELDFLRSNFFLGLRLSCREGENSFSGTDPGLRVVKDDTGRQYIEIALLVGDGAACRFTTSVYLAKQPDDVDLFSGSSQEIPNLLQLGASPVVIDASLHPRATAVCTDLAVTGEGGYKFGAVDLDEEVMLPAVEAKAVGGKVSFSLPGLPIGRQFALYQGSNVAGALLWEDTKISFLLTTINGVQEICGQ
jgi:hypothetical protein